MAERERLVFLDWMRVVAILILHFWHTGMIYTAEWSWHIKNAETSHAVLEVMFFFAQWRMALLFLISGAGTRFALGYRTGGQYLRERLKRLAVPVLFGIFFIVPPQIYFERLAKGAHFTFWQYYPTILNFHFYPKGNFSWTHLWFVVYLFFYSLLALPLFLYLRSEKSARFREWIYQALVRTRFLVLIVVLGMPYALLYNNFRETYNLIDDPTYFLFYFTFFVAGYIINADVRLWNFIEDKRRLWLQLACLAYLIINIIRWNHWMPYFGVNSPKNFAWDLLRAANSWWWVIAALGYGRALLTTKPKWLTYANEGIYPFYILHQTMIIMVGYYMVQPKEDILLKYIATAVFAFVLTVAIYEFVVRPYPVMRFLFGMKSAPKKQT